MSTALVIDASLPRNRKPQVHAALLLAKNQDTDDFTTAIPITAGSGAPSHNAAVVGELYIRTSPTSAHTVLYYATDTSGTWASINPAAFTGTSVSLTDNSATAFQFLEGANPYLTFDTANSSESVRIHKVLELLASGIDMSQGAAGQTIYVKDNEAAALAFAEGANVYLQLVTTNSGEQVVVGKPLHHAGGIATASRFTSTEQTGTGSSQNIAHGLGSTPSMVWFSVSEDPAGTGFDVAPGSHDATNCVFTVTAGVKYYVHALK